MTKRSPYTRLIAGTLLVFFFAIPVISSLLNSFTPDLATRKTIISRKTADHSRACNLLPYEEREKEEEGSGDNTPGLLSLYLTHKSISLTDLRACKQPAYTPPDFSGTAAHIPLYLAKRTLLL